MAAARAAARRQAILNSRGDRLAKLTSSARGDDPGGVYAHDDPPLPTLGTGLKNFVGEETDLPTPSATPSPSRSPAQPRATASSNTPPPEWGNPAQQQELLRALMGGAAVGQPGLQLPPGFQLPASDSANPNGDPLGPAAPEDPISTLLASLGGLGGGAGNPFAAGPPPPPARPKTLVQKLVPVLHVLSMIAMLVWFVVWKEPEVFQASGGLAGENTDEAFKAPWGSGNEVGWTRWARLAKGPPVGVLIVPSVPQFFWAFTTLQLGLQSLRIVSQPNTFRPHMLLGLALPYLPAPLPLVIITTLKYLQMGSIIIDDLAILVFGIGLLVFVSNLMT